MKYRAEIDGLRTLAVVPVILYHAGFELFSGGFVGVDVFFVISGYLITTILIEDLEIQRFSLVNFYERRARRILPALFCVMLVCIPFAWMWMLPSQMKDFSVIVDVSIDRGGCFETSNTTSHSKPTFEKHGVIHYCVPNIPSRYSRTASFAISNLFTPYLLDIAESGGFENAARFDKSLRSGMYFYHGILTNKTVATWFDLPFRDINLLLL